MGQGSPIAAQTICGAIRYSSQGYGASLLLISLENISHTRARTLVNWVSTSLQLESDVLLLHIATPRSRLRSVQVLLKYRASPSLEQNRECRGRSNMHARSFKKIKEIPNFGQELW